MTRFEDCFPPDIVRAVYDRLEREGIESRSDQPHKPTHDNVISLNAYRQKMRIEERIVVS